MLYNTTCLFILVGNAICGAGLEASSETMIANFLNTNFPSWLNCIDYQETPLPTQTHPASPLQTPELTPRESPHNTPEITPFPTPQMTPKPSPTPDPSPTPPFHMYVSLCGMESDNFSSESEEFFGSKPEIEIHGKSITEPIMPIASSVQVLDCLFSQFLVDDVLSYDLSYGLIMVELCTFHNCTSTDSSSLITFYCYKATLRCCCIYECIIQSLYYSYRYAIILRGDSKSQLVVNQSTLSSGLAGVEFSSYGYNGFHYSNTTWSIEKDNYNQIIYIDYSNERTVITFSHFANNYAHDLAMFCFDSYTRLDNCLICNNTSTEIFKANMHACDFYFCTIIKNIASLYCFAGIRDINCINCVIPEDQRSEYGRVYFINCSF